MTEPRLPAVVLCPLTWRDLARVRRWRNESRRWFHDSRYVPRTRHLRWWLAYRWRHSIGECSFVVWCHGRPVGHVAVYDYVPASRRIQFGRLVVAPEWRRAGIGEAATRQLAEWTFGHFHVEQIWLTVTADNEAATRLYERVGFERAVPFVGRVRRLVLTKHRWEEAR